MGSYSPIVVTTGDLFGVGPELVVKAWRERFSAGLSPFFVLGDSDFLHWLITKLGCNTKCLACSVDEVVDVFSSALPVVNFDSLCPSDAFVADQGLTVIDVLNKAVGLLRIGVASALVTGPISKVSLHDAGFGFSGHTDYLGYLASQFYVKADQGFYSESTDRRYKPVMLLVSPELRTVPVTVHVRITEVSELLTERLIVETAHIVIQGLRSFFGIENPRLAIAGLNPHAGEGGTIGDEERQVIGPAVLALSSAGFNVTGPYSADTIFQVDRRRDYDVVLAMYHDQALIPIKTLAFYNAVNVTIGLPFIRTSPAHGTSFDIAGKGVARADSFIAAIKLAGDMVRIKSERGCGVEY